MRVPKTSMEQRSMLSSHSALSIHSRCDGVDFDCVNSCATFDGRSGKDAVVVPHV